MSDRIVRQALIGIAGSVCVYGLLKFLLKRSKQQKLMGLPRPADQLLSVSIGDLANVGSLDDLRTALAGTRHKYSLPGYIENYVDLQINFSEACEWHKLAKSEMSKAISSCALCGDCEFTTVVAENSDLSDAINYRIGDVNAPELDDEIFSWRSTPSIAHAIRKAQEGADDAIRLFVVASQYNGAESMFPLTPAPGKAMECSEHDHTQGPNAQRQNPALFELTNALLANLGFNQLASVLSKAGYPAYNNGYLTPRDPPQLEALIADFRARWGRVEVPCLRSGRAHLILAAAPAFGQYAAPDASTGSRAEELQYLAALSGFSAQFNRALGLLEQHPDRWPAHGGWWENFGGLCGHVVWQNRRLPREALLGAYHRISSSILLTSCKTIFCNRHYLII
jgi:hypothetical protein